MSYLEEDYLQLSGIQHFRDVYLHHIDKDFCPVCAQEGGHRK